MKKITYLIIAAILAPMFLMAQGRIAEIWSQPAVFKADEQVSFFFDLSGTELAAVADNEGVCVWTWFPADPGETWGSPSAKSKLTKVEGNIWRWDLIPTEFYKVAANKVSEFYGQLQTHAGNKITVFAPDQDPPNHIAMYSLASVSDDETILDYHPKKYATNKPISVLINAKNIWPDKCDDNSIQGELANAPNVHVHAGINGWTSVVENNPANSAKTKLTDMGNGIYRWDFVPEKYFNMPKGSPTPDINAVFASSDWAFIGKNVGCTDFYIQAPVQEAQAIPELVFFPSKISKKDLLCIIRTKNETWVSSLSYTITAGTKTIQGQFEGSNKEFNAYINLVNELKDAGDVAKIHVVIKDNKGTIISENDIPLVQLNQ